MPDITKELITVSLLIILGEDVTKYMSKTCKAMDNFAKTGRGLSPDLMHVFNTFDRNNPFPEIYGLFYELDELKMKKFIKWVK